MTPFWVSGFVDLAPAAYDAGLAFWRDVTGWTVSTARGDQDEFVTLLPPVGDGHLRVQRLGRGPSRIHLDLHVADPRAAADHAVGLGAREVADHGHVVMASPGGFPFCFVTHPASTPAPGTTWPGGHRSLVDQVCIDVPAALYAREEAFWLSLTERELSDPPPGHPEFRWLAPVEGRGARVLLQRLDQPRGDLHGHLDLSATDRGAEVRRHVALGARFVGDFDTWTVLTDPAGLAYCVTDRVPR
ncbi:VOC family protein [Nocardioides coralli]|uniref:VOC family protein n=1 Tax=Nocardioides coralli TaxID=2872154 RepID=UPI001CA3B2AC|nr:VOC family protein [Nocardioides coralli]QZY28552.1 VOC family protein [Nocardioides coralli]